MLGTIRQYISGSCLTLMLVAAGQASGQPVVITQFNFNNSDTLPNVNNSAGTPSVALVGVLTPTFAAGSGPQNNASSTDPTQPGIGYNLSDFPAQGAGSGTAGIQINLPTTNTFSNLILRFDQRNSGTSARDYQLQYTIDGTNYIPLGTYESVGTDIFQTRTFDFTQVAGVNNNAIFAVRSVAIFDPANGATYTSTNTSGAYSTAGTVRYDMVTLSRGATWQGGSGGGDVGAAANYVGAAAPGAADTLVFGATANNTVNVATSATYGQLLFRSDAPAHTINASAGQTLNLGTGIVNLSTTTQTFNAPVSFGGTGVGSAASIQNNGTLIFNSPISVNANNGVTFGMTVVGAGKTIINSTFSAGTAGDLNVGPGQMLGGIGTVNNEIQNYGGIIRGGYVDGVHDFGTLTSNTAGDIELYTAPGALSPTIQVSVTRTGPGTVNNSKLAITGGTSADLEINNAAVGGPNQFVLDLLFANAVPGETYAMTILTTDSLGSIEFSDAVQGNLAFIDSASYRIQAPFGISSSQLQVVDVGGASTLVLTLTVSAVPEPSSLALIGLPMIAAGYRRWVRRRKLHRE